MKSKYNDINPHTGAELVTPPATDKYRDGWDKIWGNKKESNELSKTEETIVSSNTSDGK